jgi:chromate reductase
MRRLKILAIVGGISKGSINQKLFKAISKIAPENFEFTNFDISRLPYFSQDIENAPPNEVTEFKSLIESSDAVLLITPEYNRSIPGVLKNAIDWGSRPYGKNSWAKKKAAVLGMSAGKTGTLAAQAHLRDTLAGVGVSTMPQPQLYLYIKDTMNEAGDDFGSDKTKEFMLGFLKAFENFIA